MEPCDIECCYGGIHVAQHTTAPQTSLLHSPRVPTSPSLFTWQIPSHIPALKLFCLLAVVIPMSYGILLIYIYNFIQQDLSRSVHHVANGLIPLLLRKVFLERYFLKVLLERYFVRKPICFIDLRCTSVN